MKSIVTLSLGFLLLTSVALPELPVHFVERLDRAKMTFDEPAGLEPIEPIENRQMNWELSYAHRKKRFEVRYAIRPMDNELKQYNERIANKKEGDINIHPNVWHKSVFEATVLNISGGQLPEYTIFHPEAVKNEFNADWGATTTVMVGKEFGQDYIYCLIVFIHKHDLGDGYLFYLADDKDVLIEEMNPIFHALRFKGE